MDNTPYLLALNSLEGLGPVRLKKILDYFKDPKTAWNAPILELKSLGIPESVIEKIEYAKKTLDPFEYLENIKSFGIKFFTLFEKDYPESLKEIYDPPVVLYYFGSNLSILKEDCIAIVGTRKMTGYGRLVTDEFASKLSKAGFVIVSGLARGVDTTAHIATLNAGGKTIAILGGGLRNIFPPENTQLAQKIAQSNGLVISEFPPEYPSLPGNFPARNRVISGLSKAVLVTEAATDSGSLITARLALEQGRGVYAVPGPITSGLSKGPSELIKEGGMLVDSAEDILNDLGKDPIRPSFSSIELNDIEKEILDEISSEAKHIDEICRNLEKPASLISGSLIKMEILGVVRGLGGGVYVGNS